MKCGNREHKAATHLSSSCLSTVQSAAHSGIDKIFPQNEVHSHPNHKKSSVNHVRASLKTVQPKSLSSADKSLLLEQCSTVAPQHTRLFVSCEQPRPDRS